jgi:hypothetical protein
MRGSSRLRLYRLTNVRTPLQGWRGGLEPSPFRTYEAMLDSVGERKRVIFKVWSG